MLVPPYFVMYGKIWNLIEQCSQGLFEQGKKSFQDERDLNEATRLLSLIPKNSSLREKADEKVRYWTDEYYYRRMLHALENCNWEDVIREREKLTTDSWIKEAKLRIQEAKNPDGSLYCPDSSIPPALIPELKD